MSKKNEDIECETKQTKKKTQNTERRKTRYLQEQVDNADYYTSVMTKILTKHD